MVTYPADNRSLYSPHQAIPPELWSLIFVHCLPLRPSLKDQPIKEALRDPRNAPLTLASVCQEWRHIACNTTELWATCWVNFSRPDLNTLWLGRAGERMLYLYGAYHGDPGDQCHFDSLLQSILPFQQRWKTLELRSGKWELTTPIPQFKTLALETLRLFSLSVDQRFNWIELLASSPQLRELRIGSLALGKSSIMDLHFPHLSTLSVDQASFRDVVKVLTTLPQLQNLSVQFFLDTNEDENHPVITHTNLRSLRGVPIRSYTFRSLALPSLQRVYIPYGLDYSNLVHFIRRSGCWILELDFGYIVNWNGGGVDALECATAFSRVERLAIHGFTHADTSRIFDFLNGQNLPCLKELIIHARYTLVPEGGLADLIISRCGPSVCERNSCQCAVGQQGSQVRLMYLRVDGLNRATRSLDIARLVPLPDDRQTRRGKEAMVIDLVPVDRIQIPGSADSKATMRPYPARYMIGERSPCVC